MLEQKDRVGLGQYRGYISHPVYLQGFHPLLHPSWVLYTATVCCAGPSSPSLTFEAQPQGMDSRWELSLCGPSVFILNKSKTVFSHCYPLKTPQLTQGSECKLFLRHTFALLWNLSVKAEAGNAVFPMLAGLSSGCLWEGRFCPSWAKQHRNKWRMTLAHSSPR